MYPAYFRYDPRNSQITGWRQRSQLVIFSLLYEALTAHGVAFDGAAVCREGWGLFRAATPQRIVQALDDIRGFRASLRLLAWKIGYRFA